MNTPILVTGREQVRRLVATARRDGRSIGVVMTMGALHAGHLSLVRRCVDECDFNVVTIFVNPTQFGPEEDLEKYPRQLPLDMAALTEHAVDVVFAPDASEMYRPDHSTYIAPPRVAERLEGACRPGHFRGVTTVVLKLLNIVPADVAYFGQKDYQQYLVVRGMVAELDVATEIRICPTLRDTDGLALSSRNQYLSPSQRDIALAIPRSLELAQQLTRDGTHHAGQLMARMREVLIDGHVERIDYLAIADPETLDNVRTVERRAVALVAAYVGHTRLIDNQFLSAR